MVHQHINDNSSSQKFPLNDKEKDVPCDTPAPTFNFKLPFDRFVKTLHSTKTERKNTIRKGTHRYWTLFALYHGNVIDDYEQKPTNEVGRPVNNVVQRVNELVNVYGLPIKSRKAEKGKHYEYYLDK